MKRDRDLLWDWRLTVDKTSGVVSMTREIRKDKLQT